MKINEIILEADVVVDEWSDTDPEIKTELEKKGYKYLGQGVDQTAFSEPNTGYVLKVFGTDRNTKGSGGEKLSSSHQMFLTWAKYCMAHKDNPYLPKFYGFEKFIFKDHT